MTEIKLLGKASMNVVSRIETTFSSQDICFLFVDYAKQDVEIGFVFNEIVVLEEVKKMKAVLVFVTQQYFKPLPFVPLGYKSIVGLEILSEDKSIFDKLPEIDGWSGSSFSVKLIG